MEKWQTGANMSYLAILTPNTSCQAICPLSLNLWVVQGKFNPCVSDSFALSSSKCYFIRCVSCTRRLISLSISFSNAFSLWSQSLCSSSAEQGSNRKVFSYLLPQRAQIKVICRAQQWQILLSWCKVRHLWGMNTWPSLRVPMLWLYYLLSQSSFLTVCLPLLPYLKGSPSLWNSLIFLENSKQSSLSVCRVLAPGFS